MLQHGKLIVIMKAHDDGHDAGRFLNAHAHHCNGKRDDASSRAIVHEDFATWRLEDAGDGTFRLIKHDGLDNGRKLDAHAHHCNGTRDDHSSWALVHANAGGRFRFRLTNERERKYTIQKANEDGLDAGRFLNAHAHHGGGKRDDSSSWAMLHTDPGTWCIYPAWQPNVVQIAPTPLRGTLVYFKQVKTFGVQEYMDWIVVGDYEPIKSSDGSKTTAHTQLVRRLGFPDDQVAGQHCFAGSVFKEGKPLSKDYLPLTEAPDGMIGYSSTSVGGKGKVGLDLVYSSRPTLDTPHSLTHASVLLGLRRRGAMISTP